MSDHDCTLICGPSSDPHRVPGAVSTCARCGAGIYVSDDSVEHCARMGALSIEFVCIPCITPEIENEPDVPIHIPALGVKMILEEHDRTFRQS